jgi:hypothetical protein
MNTTCCPRAKAGGKRKQYIAFATAKSTLLLQKKNWLAATTLGLSCKCMKTLPHLSRGCKRSRPSILTTASKLRGGVRLLLYVPITLALWSAEPLVTALHGCGGLYASAGARRGELNSRHYAMWQMLQAQVHHIISPGSSALRDRCGS